MVVRSTPCPQEVPQIAGTTHLSSPSFRSICTAGGTMEEAGRMGIDAGEFIGSSRGAVPRA